MIKTFSASLDQLYDMLGFIKEQAEYAGFDPPAASKIELASEEALVNIVSYGYSSYHGIIEIGCFHLGGGGLKIVIKDRGRAYNPLANSKKCDLQSPMLEERTIGGYGVFFILKMMHEVDYKREKDTNVLTLVRYINHGQVRSMK